mgnify:CR=1 FL=1
MMGFCILGQEPSIELVSTFLMDCKTTILSSDFVIFGHHSFGYACKK